ncbi:unnamed protein product [Spirodela intermedia]|uniref:Ribosomal protein L32 n=1 Tax=Spirodela intermedia TaxID=51605 RepID=A0ABN7EDY4_SPIIN|nr:unnamed protein product [Spirodela intermedia]
MAVRKGDKAASAAVEVKKVPSARRRLRRWQMVE